jgi:protein SCO1/2
MYDRPQRTTMFSRLTSSIVILALVSIALVSITSTIAPPALANIEERPRELIGVDITEKVGKSALLNTHFTDHLGQRVTLDQYFQDGLPVILTLNYYRCRMLCSQQLNGFLDALRPLPWSPGDRFRILTVSIDPREDPILASGKRQSYLDALGKGDVDWQFLTSDAANAQMLADSVGFGYQYDPTTDQYAHVSALIILSPNGTISRYLYGIEYDPSTLKDAILQAAAGQTTNSFDQPNLACFADFKDVSQEVSRRNRLIMQITCSACAIAFGGFLAFWWRRDLKRPSTPPST